MTASSGSCDLFLVITWCLLTVCCRRTNFSRWWIFKSDLIGYCRRRKRAWSDEHSNGSFREKDSTLIRGERWLWGFIEFTDKHYTNPLKRRSDQFSRIKIKLVYKPFIGITIYDFLLNNMNPIKKLTLMVAVGVKKQDMNGAASVNKLR